MAVTDSPITLLKNLFLSFFQKMTPGYWTNPEGKGRGFSFNKSDFEKGMRLRLNAAGRAKAKTYYDAYKNTSTATILGFNDTVLSLVSVIGQAGIDAWNTWISTYAGGTGEISRDGLKALQDWYNQYLKPLN